MAEAPLRVDDWRRAIRDANIDASKITQEDLITLMNRALDRIPKIGMDVGGRSLNPAWKITLPRWFVQSRYFKDAKRKFNREKYIALKYAKTGGKKP